MAGWNHPRNGRIKMIHYKYRDIDEQAELAPGQSGLQFAEKYLPRYQQKILVMAIDGELQNLNQVIPEKTQVIVFYDIQDSIGAASLSMTATAIMICAGSQLFPDVTFSVEHSLSTGYYCLPDKIELLPPDYLKLLAVRISDIIQENITIREKELPVEDIKALNHGRFQFIEDIHKESIRISFICKQPHWFAIPLLPETGRLERFRLQPYGNGFVLQFPNSGSPDSLPAFRHTNKLFDIFQESEKRGQLLEINYIHQLNKKVSHGRFIETIQLYEALHEKKIAEIADMIQSRRKDVRFVLIAGPSSSGKTSFMKRLQIHLKINGIKSKPISLDDYFIDRDKVPLDENSNMDFEHFETVDHIQLTEDLQNLLRGKAVRMPRFDFISGTRKYQDTETQLFDDEILIIEGIHGLNPELTGNIPRSRIFRIYISALTQLNFNIYNRVSTSDTRLLRRMLRDKQFRGYPVEKTLKQWDSVRIGESRWIFPFQEEADGMFNSALEYEWGVFRPYLEDDLRNIPIDSPFKPNAERILDLLELFLPIPGDMIPPTSIIREFIGGSSLEY